MNEEENYKRFFLLLFIFIVRIVILIFFSNLYMSFIGWDALGITSYLIVIYYKNRKRLGSGMITALSNRLGDSFFFIILGFLITDHGGLLLALMLIMSLTKRAQFPFSA